MGLCHDGAYAALHLRGAVAGAKRHAEQVNAVAAVVGLLHQGDGHHHGLVGTAVDAHRAVGVVDAHHLVVGGVDLYALSAGVSPAGKQTLVDALADDTDAAPVGDVHLVDVSPVVELGRFHLGIVGQHALERATAFLVVMDGEAAPAREHRTDHAELGHLCFQPLDVAIGQSPGAPLAEAVVGLGGRLWEEDETVGGETLEVGRQQILQALSAAHERHQHEDAPEHAEARQQGARLVAGDGVEDLAVSVYVKSHGEKVWSVLMVCVAWGLSPLWRRVIRPAAPRWASCVPP